MEQATNFFSLMEAIIPEGGSINLIIGKKGGNLVVSTLPQSEVQDEAFKTIRPLVLIHPALALDDSYFPTITKGTAKAFDVLEAVKKFEDSVTNAEKSSKMATSAKKDKEAKVKEVGKFQTTLDEAKAAAAAKDWKKAETLFKAASKLEGATDLTDQIMEATAMSRYDEAKEGIAEAEAIMSSLADKSDDEVLEAATKVKATLTKVNHSVNTTKVFVPELAELLTKVTELVTTAEVNAKVALVVKFKAAGNFAQAFNSFKEAYKLNGEHITSFVNIRGELSDMFGKQMINGLLTN